MGDVLELHTLKKRFERFWLNAVGLSLPLHWAVIDGTMGKTYRFCGISAYTSLVARYRLRGVFVINLLEGDVDKQFNRDWVTRCVLNSLVVSKAKNLDESFIPFVIFDDGTRWELQMEAAIREGLWKAANTEVKRIQVGQVSTEVLATRLAPSFAKYIRCVRVYEDD